MVFGLVFGRGVALSVSARCTRSVLVVVHPCLEVVVAKSITYID